MTELRCAVRVTNGECGRPATHYLQGRYGAVPLCKQCYDARFPYGGELD